MVNGSTPAEVEITEGVVRGLLRAQCPSIADRALAPFNNGWDNDIWALGDDLLVRLPRRQAAAQLVLNEQVTLPVLAPRLSLPVPVPVHAGVPQGAYPWHWSVVPRFAGIRAAESSLVDPETEAVRLAGFLREVRKVAERFPDCALEEVIVDAMAALRLEADAAAGPALPRALPLTGAGITRRLLHQYGAQRPNDLGGGGH